MNDSGDLSVEERLERLEARIGIAEDHLAIINLLNRYGPLVDGGAGREAAQLWAQGGHYVFSSPDGADVRLEAPEDLARLYTEETHLDLIQSGSAHVTATPVVVVDGDHASAVAYSLVLVRADEGWNTWRVAINHWTLGRTNGRWHILERRNHVADGSERSHWMMRQAVDPSSAEAEAVRQPAGPRPSAPRENG